MKVTLYVAISADGFLARTDGDTDWISNSINQDFQSLIKEAGCFVVGKRSFDQYYGELYPLKNILNLVLTKSSIESPKDPNVIYANSPHETIQLAKQQGHKQIIVVGGGTTNGLFLKENLIDDTYLIVHPLILGEGIKLFVNFSNQCKLKLLDSKTLSEGLIQLHYQVIK